MSPLTESTRLTLRKTWQPMDTDAAAYIAAVESADGQALEERTKIAIDNFVLGCKADGIWTALKASCILAGARTLAGALVPLVGTAPTNVGPFVTGDYNRKTGLTGSSTKNINSNRNNNQEPQNSKHLCFYVSAYSQAITLGANSGSGQNGRTFIQLGSNNQACNTGAYSTAGVPTVGFSGVNRNDSSIFTLRTSNINYIAPNGASTSPVNWTYGIFNGDGSSAVGSTNTIAFYSIGESLDLQRLDSRVTDLITAFGVAIP
jgi:hypothetical protein